MARPSQGSMSVILAPFSKNENSETSSVRFVTLRHPRTKQPVLYGLSNSNKTNSKENNGHNSNGNSDNIQFLEVQSINEEYGAWAIGENILGGTRSSAHLCTPFDPLMVILPYLIIGKERNMVVPLEDLVHDVLTEEDNESDEKIESGCFSIIDELLQSSIVSNRLHKIADSVGSKDLNVWKWNEEKSLNFLSAKVIKLEKRLQLNKSSIADDGSVDIGYTARSTTAKRADTGSVDQRYLRLACEIVSDYLPESFSLKLATKLNINLKESQTLTPLAKKAKLDNPVSTGPLDDYTKGKKPLSSQTKKAELTAKQKAASRACVGTKSIASFFSKK